MGTEMVTSQSGRSGDSQQSRIQSLASKYAVSSSLQRQGSMTKLNSLGRKTVDDVWKDIQLSTPKGEEEQASSHESQASLGEMTLEEFLLKTGAADKDIATDVNYLTGNTAAVRNVPISSAGSQDFWLQNYRTVSIDRQMQGQLSMRGAYMPSCPVPQPLAVDVAPILDSVFLDSSPSLGTLSDSQTPGRKRGAHYDSEDKLVERRQKRMIKNRESAARSRARKQAYTNELESKVIRLEEENERLKKQQELDKIIYAAPVPEPKYRLRRANSALF